MEKNRLSHLLSHVYTTDDTELACAELQSLLPAFVEAELTGREAHPQADDIHVHLTHCDDCEATYQGLRYVLTVEAEDGLPAPAETLAA